MPYRHHQALGCLLYGDAGRFGALLFLLLVVDSGTEFASWKEGLICGEVEGREGGREGDEAVARKGMNGWIERWMGGWMDGWMDGEGHGHCSSTQR